MNSNNQEIEIKNSIIANMSREEKIKMLLDYARECYKNRHKPTKRVVRKRFHLEIYNYFENIADYHRKAGIPVSLRNYPKDKARKLITGYLQNKAKEGFYLNRKEIENALKIHFSTYFKDLKAIYDSASIDYNFIQNRNNKLIADARLGDYTIEEGRNLILEHIREEVKNGNYPTLKGIYKKFKIAFYRYFKSIFEAYYTSGVKYPFDSSNFLSKEKEKVLTEISEKLLGLMNYKIERISIRSSHRKNTGSDLLIKDFDNNPVCVEIKAFHKDQGITPREIKQLRHYMELNKCSNGILITTSTLITRDVSDGIETIDANKLIKLLKDYNLDYYIQSIAWIMNERIGSSDEKLRDKIKQKVIDYYKKNNCKNTRKELEKIFSIDLRTYFGDCCMSKLKALTSS